MLHDYIRQRQHSIVTGFEVRASSWYFAVKSFLSAVQERDSNEKQVRNIFERSKERGHKNGKGGSSQVGNGSCQESLVTSRGGAENAELSLDLYLI